MELFTFKGGIHPPENKEVTEGKSIEIFPAPKMVYIPVLQHIGAPLEPVVKVGDRVLKGQKIADSTAFLSSPIHSSVSGTVKKLEVMPYAVNGRVTTVVIENDFQDEWDQEVLNEKIVDYKSASKKELLDIIRAKGIVGQGGATFPTHIKLNPPADKKIDALLLNGAECEPYLNADNRLMLEQTEKMVEGIKVLLQVLGIEKAYVGIENNKIEAIEKMQKACEGTTIEVAPLQTKYPQGGEKQLIKAVLDRDVPSGKLPAEVGVVVQNTATALSVYNAVVEGIPLIEKVLTVSGEGVKEPKNLKVVIGTQFKEILESAGIEREKVEKIVMGGPMMGLSQHTEEVSVIKGTSGILALTKAETKPYKAKACISCGKCVDACPMNLVPLMYAKLAKFEQWEDMQEYYLMDCIECGTCAFVCPANRPLTEAIKVGKAKLRSMKK